jgi:hypothetical protein
VKEKDTLPEVIAKASKALWQNQDGKRLFLSSGGEIDDIEVLRENDLIYVSKGEPYEGTIYDY